MRDIDLLLAAANEEPRKGQLFGPQVILIHLAA